MPNERLPIDRQKFQGITAGRVRGARGYTLTELLAVAAILAVVASVIVPRVVTRHNEARSSACQTNKRDIEIQAELWRQEHGNWPQSDLADIGATSEYFPEGLPTCPVDGTPYTLDTSSGLVNGHNH